ncbi:MAG: aldehyde dehydrogenase family protein, partial [Oscillospiraceae bacterium]|nr:aldehyde dehydrogenase family protein [Oscillospiraceae bacterium]
MHEYKILINGKLTLPVRGGTMGVINPHDGSLVATVPRCTAEDVDLAVRAANAAQDVWRNTYVGKRAEILIRVSQLIAGH